MKNYRVSIVGGESLLGKEIREVLRVSSHPLEVSLVGDDEQTGKFAEEDGEAVAITAMEQTGLVTSDFVVLAGSAASSRKAWEMIGPGPGPFVVDASRALDSEPSARVNGQPPDSPAITPHPVAQVLSDFFGRLARLAPTRAVVNVMEPASERAQSGIDELHKQTVNLFSFQQLPKDIFDEQAAYNVLAALGSEAAPSLEQVEAQIDRHYASLASAAPHVMLPSIRVVQAPVFHGHSMSVWVEFDAEVNVEQIESALMGTGVDLRTGAEPPPNNVSVASQPGFAVGDVRRDRNHPRAWWLWIAMDNLRIAAESTVRLLEHALGARP